jgi:NAD(P)-dependent dehydrogenase (short-subunit alcohol dehydrogenase family)
LLVVVVVLKSPAAMVEIQADNRTPGPIEITRAALVTGAGSGIGRAIAIALAIDGYRLLLTGRVLEKLQATAQAIEAGGGLASVFSADLASRESCDALADWVVRGGKPLTVLVHNAGIGGPTPLEDRTSAEFDRRLEVNLVAPLRLTRALLPRIPQDGTGRIVFVASVLARFGVPGYHGYCASKTGVVGLARALSRDLAKDRITVNAICPGWVRTDMAETGLRLLGEAQGCDTREAERRAMEQVPLGRLLDPVEVAALVRFIVSPGAAGLTGQAVNFDAGVLA